MQSDPIPELASPSVARERRLAPGSARADPGAAVPQLHPMPRPFTSVTSLENLEGIEPIAEALIKTLAGKARTGRLDELKALGVVAASGVAVSRWSGVKAQSLATTDEAESHFPRSEVGRERENRPDSCRRSCGARHRPLHVAPLCKSRYFGVGAALTFWLSWSDPSDPRG